MESLLDPNFLEFSHNTKNTKLEIDSDMDNIVSKFEADWGLSLEEVYGIAKKFFKEKDGSKAFTATYKDRVKSFALIRQVAYGKFDPKHMPDLGLFDVMGNDRKQAWQLLGNMSQEKAMVEFVSLLTSLCPLFSPYVTAHRVEKEELERRKREETEEQERIARLKQEEESAMREQLQQRQFTQEMMIRTALNRQTAEQFRHYAQLQYPGDLLQQDALIAQLQEQHYIQYIQQVYNQQQQQQQQWNSLPASSTPISASSTSQKSNSTSVASQHTVPSTQPSSNGGVRITQTTNGQTGQNRTESSERSPSQPAVSPDFSLPSKVSGPSMGNGASGPSMGNEASGPSMGNGASGPSMGNGVAVSDNRISTNSAESKVPSDVDEPPILETRQGIKEFKESFKNEKESIIKVGSGELVTVRVPTNENSSRLNWEFATDGSDIGFGVSFERTKTPDTQRSIQVIEVDGDDEDSPNKENEASDGSKTSPPTDVIIPVYRRGSHLEVYSGSHVYHDSGVYLLHFDNSYSLWRSKSVYYRVYYSNS